VIPGKTADNSQSAASYYPNSRAQPPPPQKKQSLPRLTVVLSFRKL